MIFLLLIAGLAEGASTYKGNLVKGEPWKVKTDTPRRGEFCLELNPELKKKKWLVDGLYVEIEGSVLKGEACLAVKTMLPATYDPARTVIRNAIKR